MMVIRALFAFVLSSLFLSVVSRPSLGHAGTLCPGLESETELDFEFSDSELLMLCPNNDYAKTPYQTWSEIPKSQSALHLRAFLQSRGYLKPQIDLTGDKIIFNAGTRTLVKEIEISGAPENLNFLKKRNLFGDPLTPSYLNDLENGLKGDLQYLGYPCALIDTSADATSGKISAKITAGPQSDFGPVDLVSTPQFNSQILKRYHVFKPDQTYNRLLLQVSEERMLTEGVVERSEFITDCIAPSHPLRQVYYLGEPRIGSVTLMASTEVGLEVTGSLRRTRVDRYGSYYNFIGILSARLQEFSAYYHWYFKDFESSEALRPLSSYRRQNERHFELTTEQLQVAYLRRWDNYKEYSLTGSIGPELEWIQVRRGLRAGEDLRTVGVQSQLQIESYEHEIYRRNIFEGYRFRILGKSISEDISSDFSAHTLNIDGDFLFNILNYSPPRWMLAWRMGASTTHSADPQELPPNYRQYLGGIGSLRGFSRLELPTSGEGALSRLFTGVELRAGHWSETLLPVAFIDAGWLGVSSYKLDTPIFWSPGLGFNWRSPLGPLRGTVAYGFGDKDISDEDKKLSKWQFFLSLGEQF